MSDNKDIFSNENEDFENIFKNLRQKYNVDEEGTYKKEEDGAPILEKDRELEEFFNSSEKLAKQTADKYLSVFDDYDPDGDDQPPKNPESADYEWDNNTVLDFGDKNPENQSSEKEEPTEFEDIFSLVSDSIIAENARSKENAKENNADVREEPAEEIVDIFSGEESKEEIPDTAKDQENSGDIYFDKKRQIKTDEAAEKEEEFPITEAEEISEEKEIETNDINIDNARKTAADIENTQVINKDITYEDINWDDFPLGKEKIKKVQPSSEKKKKKKRRKKRSLFPKKGDEPGEIVRKLIIIVSIIAILVSGGWLLKDTVIEPWIAEKLNNKLTDSLVDTKTNKVVKNFGELDKSDQVLTASKLLEQNKDYVGWLTVKGADISLPVVHPDNNDKYVRRGYDGDYLFAGTLFVDARVDSMFDRNIIIYGHNMGNGSMFGSLRNYRTSDKSFYKENNLITFHTIYGAFTYEIFAAYTADGTGDNDKSFISKAVVTNPSNEDFINYINQVYKKRYCDPGVDVRENDKIITLITCDKAQWETGRLVVLGRLVSFTK